MEGEGAYEGARMLTWASQRLTTVQGITKRGFLEKCLQKR